MSDIDMVINNFSFSIIGALIVYDITDIDSFQKMNQWVKELR